MAKVLDKIDTGLGDRLVAHGVKDADLVRFIGSGVDPKLLDETLSTALPRLNWPAGKPAGLMRQAQRILPQKSSKEAREKRQPAFLQIFQEEMPRMLDMLMLRSKEGRDDLKHTKSRPGSLELTT
jgi:hypothetical protein